MFTRTWSVSHYMGSFFLHFIPLGLISWMIIRLFSKRWGDSPSGILKKTVLISIAALFVYRPFIAAMWLISPAGILAFFFSSFLYAYFKNRIAREFVYTGVKTLIMFFPVYLFAVILYFSLSVGNDCSEMDAQPGMKPLYSLCAQEKQDTARQYTNDIFHCRHAFISSLKNTIYVGFGAETNQRGQVLLGIDENTGAITRAIPSYTIFRGWCLKEKKVCLNVVSPKNIIWLWDDENLRNLDHFVLPERDRPRFISVDAEKPIVYVVYEGNAVIAVNMEKSAEAGKLVIEKTLRLPTSALATVTNTKKRIVANTAHFFNPRIIVVEKDSGETYTIPVGPLRILKSFGMFFHVEGDPDHERAFVGAPFEGAVYMVDLDKKKEAWRLPLPVGVRDLGYDSRRQVLYASNFVNGDVYVIDVSGAKPVIKDKLFVGRRVRFFNYEKDEDFFLSASSNGFYIYYPDARNAKRDISSRNLNKSSSHQTE